MPYRALDPELIGWVHTCIPWAVMTAFERFNRPLSDDERDRYLREQAVIGRMGGADEIPETAPSSSEYVEAMRPKLAVNEQTREFFEFLMSRRSACCAARAAVAPGAPLPARGGHEPDAALGPADDRLRPARARPAHRCTSRRCTPTRGAALGVRHAAVPALADERVAHAAPGRGRLIRARPARQSVASLHRAAGAALPGARRDADYGALEFPEDEHQHVAGWDYWWGAADIVTKSGNRYTSASTSTRSRRRRPAASEIFPRQGPYKGRTIILMDGPESGATPPRRRARRRLR